MASPESQELTDVPSDLTTAIFALTAEKDLPREVVVAAVEDALAITYRKQYGTVPEARVIMDLRDGTVPGAGQEESGYRRQR